ncbi:hypothetical protein J4212_03965 [Candidatus Woesearchaeota archaeon]|nr:hypothetical protein [Candidatus Woesearchaeota archaeon]
MSSFKESYFLRTAKLIKNNYDVALTVLVIDLVFFTAAFFIKGLFPASPISQLIYFAVMVLAYSISKFLVISSISGVFSPKKTEAKLFPKFLGLNAMLAVALNVFAFAILFFISMMKPLLGQIMFIVLSLALLFFFYPLLNFSHSCFSDTKKFAELLRKSLGMAFAKISSYIGLYLWSIASMIVLFALWYFIGANSILKDYAQYYIRFGNNLALYPATIRVYLIALIAIPYLILFFNRFYFYLIAREKGGK